MISSDSRRRAWMDVLAFLGTLWFSFPAALPAGAQAPPAPPSGPPPPFKPVVSVRFGGAYDGPRFTPHRTILGWVKDEEGQVVATAMVYIKDIQGKSTLVATVDANGAFHFGSLTLTHDYEIWAEAGELKSPIRSVTTFMTQNEVSMPLLMRAERNRGTPELKRRPAATGNATAVQGPDGQEPKSSGPVQQ
ncbi:hypothetical protein SAMN05421771_2056 [Granulicella pectinivorans]|uniref:Carboxypeptidase regulatory-like domain-containing protein n=1 Tax=Granulicella pectinivorans TaxID=474950 RepID=A0A1I6M932_9BACT|nr:hypothetical protein SAMN05421771_2056 [Granulicella pectinivorans]